MRSITLTADRHHGAAPASAPPGGEPGTRTRPAPGACPRPGTVSEGYWNKLLQLSSHDDLGPLLREAHGVEVRHDDRHGLTVVVADDAALRRSRTADAFLRFRLVHYLAAGVVDGRTASQAGWTKEPTVDDGAQGVHVLALDHTDHRLLCCATLRRPAVLGSHRRLAARDRPALAVEEAFGVGVFDSLPEIAGLRLAQVAEIKRLVRDQRPRTTTTIRAVLEVLCGLHAVAVDWADEVVAYVGDFEPHVLGPSLRLLGAPVRTVPPVAPTVPPVGDPASDGRYMRARYDHGDVRAFAILTADLAAGASARIGAVDAALDHDDATLLGALDALLSG